MAVTRRVFVASGAVTAASYLLGVERAAAARRRKRVFAHAGLAQGVGTVGLTVARTRYLETGSQAAVALTPLDGEIISGTTQSNFQGNGFYGRNGFTRARDWTGPKPAGGSYTGWDDVNFLPIGTWLTDFTGTGFYDRMDDLGLNSMLPRHQSVSLANNIIRGKGAFVAEDQVAGGTISSADDPGVVGVIAGEEPATVAAFNTIIADTNAWLATSDGPGRMGFINYSHHVLNFHIENTIFPDDMVTATDIISMDEYWFAGAPTAQNQGFWLHFGMYQISGDATPAETARGSNYGSMMDTTRKSYPAGQVHPFWVWIENGAPYDPAGSAEITPSQMKWAIWATLVHGARIIGYFNHTFRAGDPKAGFNNFNNDAYGGPGIAGSGMYAAAKEVNLRALALASVINSPFDGYLCFGDGLASYETAGFLTACTSTNARGRYSGVDASCKWQPVQQKHYILATTRELDGTTNWPVTFRMVDQGQTTAVEVHESNSIAIQRGGAIPGGFCEFSDTFATAASYKTYRID